MGDFYTVKEVADKLGFTVPGVQKWIREGRVTAFKFGREYRILKSDLDDFVAKNKKPAKE